MLCLAEPILSRIADRDGTSLYPLMYPSRLGPLDMFSPPLALVGGAPVLLPVMGDANGSLVFHRPVSLPFSLVSFLFGDTADAKVGMLEPAECERIIALAGSFKRPDGDEVYGDAAMAAVGTLGLMASFGLEGVVSMGLGVEELPMLVAERG